MILPGVCFALILVVSVLGIQLHIDLRKYPPYVAVALTLAIFLPLSIILLLPIDYVSLNFDLRVFDLPPRWVLVMWKLNYWTTFLLTWLILPLLQEYYRLARFSSVARWKDALKQNVKFQLVVLGASALGIVYLTLETGLTFSHLRMLIIALSHIYSLVLALWLMAHGLVQLPKEKWTEGSNIAHLNHLYLKVPRLVDALEDTKILFKEDILQLLAFHYHVASLDITARDWVLRMYDDIPGDLREQMARMDTHVRADQVTDEALAALALRFTANRRKLLAHESEFNALFRRIIKLEDVLGAEASGSHEVVMRVDQHREMLNPRWSYYYYCYMRPIGNRVLLAVLLVASFVVIESELFHLTRMSLVNGAIHAPQHMSGITRLGACAAFFAYMLFAALHLLTHLKVFNMYHLVPRNSDPVLACFYATYVARMTIPLSYNFVTLFIVRKSTFEEWFGQSIHLTGLFNLLNNWLPRFVVVPIALNVFDVYGRVKRRLGLSFSDSWVLGDSESDDEGSANKRSDLMIVEAKRIINREYAKRHGAADLRPFNLARGTNGVASSEVRDDVMEDTDLESGVEFPRRETSSPLWATIGRRIEGLRGAVFGTRVPYRDDPLDNEDVI